ncbi:hypothetical protein F4775DRAFT_3395 [Biscogniauxia sp. FL1348]|nr:hypothetical protein F4775DRAFT_3395 [Biscogniauxia sp. FL1348]
MSEGRPSSSFGDPNAQPPTPKQTPTSAAFPSPVLETPKNNRGSFEDSSGWTPRFAEEYSVFNSTPGNLRGSQGPFLDYTVSTPYEPSEPKLPISAENIAVEIATHVNHFSSNSNLPLPPVDPSRRLQSSPIPIAVTGFNPPEPDFQSVAHQRSARKSQSAIRLETETQTATPPPSARKGERRLAPKLQTVTMQNDEFEQDFVVGGTPQQQHMATFATTPIDMYGVPLSAPAAAPGFGDTRSFWDTDMGGMDLDFSGGAMFQTSNHRPMNSLDWAKSNEMFQETRQAPPPNQENNPPAKKERVLAPKPPLSSIDTSMVDASMFGPPFSAPVDDPFSMMSHGGGGGGGGVDPGLLFTRPPSSGMEPAPFDIMGQSSLMQTFPPPEPLPIPAKPAKESKRGQVRRSASTKEKGAGKKIDRASASSPVKSTGRPNMSRSVSETRGRKPGSKASSLPNLAPAIRPGPPPSNVRLASQAARANGRTSPLKNDHSRLSSLSSIPESLAPRTRTSVKFTIDSRGRARAETTVIVDDDTEQRASSMGPQRQPRSRSRNWHSSDDDESSTDDEPIIIPSRNNSFAVPAPQNPTVPRHSRSPQKYPSDQSASSLGIYYDLGSPHNDDGSDAETVMNVPGKSSRGDAVSELRKVVEDRQKRIALNTSQRFLSGQPYSANSTMSSTSITEASLPTPSSDGGNQIRCVCNTTDSHINGDGYMVQCESCEMWLHGKCINITRQTLPRVYICAFCANTPNAHGMRGREIRRNQGGSNPRISATSPLAHKSAFKSFR